MKARIKDAGGVTSVSLVFVSTWVENKQCESEGLYRSDYDTDIEVR